MSILIGHWKEEEPSVMYKIRKKVIMEQGGNSWNQYLIKRFAPQFPIDYQQELYEKWRA